MPKGPSSANVNKQTRLTELAILVSSNAGGQPRCPSISRLLPVLHIAVLKPLTSELRVCLHEEVTLVESLSQCFFIAPKFFQEPSPVLILRFNYRLPDDRGCGTIDHTRQTPFGTSSIGVSQLFSVTSTTNLWASASASIWKTMQPR